MFKVKCIVFIHFILFFHVNILWILLLIFTHVKLNLKNYINRLSYSFKYKKSILCLLFMKYKHTKIEFFSLIPMYFFSNFFFFEIFLWIYKCIYLIIKALFKILFTTVPSTFIETYQMTNKHVLIKEIIVQITKNCLQRYW